MKYFYIALFFGLDVHAALTLFKDTIPIELAPVKVLTLWDDELRQYQTFLIEFVSTVNRSTSIMHSSTVSLSQAEAEFTHEQNIREAIHLVNNNLLIGQDSESDSDSDEEEFIAIE